MSKKELVALGAFLAALLIIARNAWAVGDQDCVASLAANGTLNCVSNECEGNCAGSGYVNYYAPDEWLYNTVTGQWVFVQSHDYGETDTEGCQCNGSTHPCCNLVKIKDGAGFKYGVYGTCLDCDPQIPGICKPSGNPVGNVTATCD